MRLSTLLFTLCCAALCACQPAIQPPVAPLPDVTIGVVNAVQPLETADLLAGFIPEKRGIAEPRALNAFDAALMDHLQRASTHRFVFIPAAPDNLARLKGQDRRTVLRYFLDLGRTHKVDLIIVPQILSWHERDGGPAGVVTPAELECNFFLIDTRGEGSLVSRSHTAERQRALASNLLDIGTFIKRGGKWVTTLELATEAMTKMIKEFGL